MTLIDGKKYICKVVSYDSAKRRGMLRLSIGEHTPFRAEDVVMNLTQPGNEQYEPDHMVVFQFSLERRFELSEKPFYLGGCV